MKIVGIIIEANPLHNGHQYLIDEIKNNENPDLLIAVSSTYFSMRGDISCYPKSDKTNYLLDAGFDLVFELPTALSMQRSDIFARNAIDILLNLKATHLAFGMEDNDPYLIEKATNTYSSLSYQERFNQLLKENNNYKKAQVLALKAFLSEEEWESVNNNNFFLGLEYLKIIKKTNLTPIVIKRIGPKYNELTESNNLASATFIRKLIKENQSITKYLNYQPKFLVDLNQAENLVLKYWQYLAQIQTQLLTQSSINNYIIKNTKNDDNYDLFIDRLTTNKFTKTRIKRTILTNLIGYSIDFTKFPVDIPYLRLLGYNQKGLKYLNQLPKEQKSWIFSSPKELSTPNIILEYELKAAKLYNLFAQNDFLINEYQLPIRKE